MTLFNKHTGGNKWQYPPLSLLNSPPPSSEISVAEDVTLQLENTLREYGVKGVVKDISKGPVATLYEFKPAAGTRSSKLISLAPDIARSMSVNSIRVSALPSSDMLGVEIPNKTRDTVYIQDLLSSEQYSKEASQLPIALGKNISGEPVIADLSKMPHLLIAGTTGSGKSVGLNAMIISLLMKNSPDELKLIMIDPKMLELSVYNGIPHLLAPVITEPTKAITALQWLTHEMHRRYSSMADLGVRNIRSYNEIVNRGDVVIKNIHYSFNDAGKPVYKDVQLLLRYMPHIVVVIDEVADLMMTAGKDVESVIQRLAQMARAAGIHIIMATQRPSVNVITGVIKANLPTRISYQVTNAVDSRVVIGESGAEHLLGNGDLLLMQNGVISRVHGPFVSDAEVERVVAFLRSQEEPVYDPEVVDGVQNLTESSDE